MAQTKSTSSLTVTVDDLGSGWQITKLQNSSGRLWEFPKCPFFRCQVYDTTGGTITQAKQSDFTDVQLTSMSDTWWQLTASGYTGISGVDLEVSIGIRLDGDQVKIQRPRASTTSTRYLVQSMAAPITLVTPTQTVDEDDEVLLIPMSEGALIFDPAHNRPDLFSKTENDAWDDGTNNDVWTISTSAGKIDGAYWLDRGMTMQMCGYYNRTSGEGLYWQTTCRDLRQVAWGFDERTTSFMMGVMHFTEEGMRSAGSGVNADYDVVIEPIVSDPTWTMPERYRSWREANDPTWMHNVKTMGSDQSLVSGKWRSAQWAHVQSPATGSGGEHAAVNDRMTEMKVDLNKLATDLGHTNIVATVYQWQQDVTGDAISWPDVTKQSNTNAQLALVTSGISVGLYTTPLKNGTENTTTAPEILDDFYEADSAGTVIEAENVVWGQASNGVGNGATVDARNAFCREAALDMLDPHLRASGVVNVGGIYFDTWPNYNGPSYNDANPKAGGSDRLKGAREFIRMVRDRFREEKGDFWIMTEFPTEHMVGVADAALCGITQITNTTLIDGTGNKGASYPQLWNAVYGEHVYMQAGEGIALSDTDETDISTAATGLAQLRIAMCGGALPASICRLENDASYEFIPASGGLGTNGQEVFDAMEEFTDWLDPTNHQRNRDYYLEGRRVKPPTSSVTANFADRFWGADPVGWFPGLTAAITDTDLTVGCFTCAKRGGLMMFFQNGTGAELTDTTINIDLSDYPFLSNSGLSLYSIASNGTPSEVAAIPAGTTAYSWDIASIAADVTAWYEIV